MTVRFRSLPVVSALVALFFIGVPLRPDPQETVKALPSSTPGKPPRVDAAFTLAVKTPHVPWGKPSPFAPVHAFVVPSVSEGRTLVELAERMDLTFDTVMIDEAWDVNTWTVGTDEKYEARNYKLLYKYLEEDLAQPSQYDVIVLPSLHGWNRLPAVAREKVRERVEQGTGLVLVHPTTGLPAPDDSKLEGPMNDFAPSRDVASGEELWEISPLVGALSDRIDAKGFREIRPDAVAGGAWKTVGEHFITANLPLDSFPADDLKHYKYRLAKDAQALVVGPDGEPVVAVKAFGKGRVVALGYVNTGLSPLIPRKILGQKDDHWWEYFYSLLCRSVLWAAKREPRLTLGPLSVVDGAKGRNAVTVPINNSAALPAADISMRVFNAWGEAEGSLRRHVPLKPGTNTFALDLPFRMAAGRHCVDTILIAGGKHDDWGSASFSLDTPDEIVSLSTDREFYSRGDKIQVNLNTRTRLAGGFVVELLDNRGRLLARRREETPENSEATAQTTLEVGNYSTSIGWVRVQLLGSGPDKDRKIDQKQVRVNFSSLDRDFGAYELIMPWYGPPTYQPWTPALDEQFRRIGVTVVESPERNFKLIKQIQTPGFCVYWHYRKEYLHQKDKFLETGNKKFLIRQPDLASDEWLEKLRGLIRNDMERDKGFRPMAYYLADESSLTAYGDPFDLSWSVPTLSGFREWLKTQYLDLAALNQEWGTKYRLWDRVVPLTTTEAQSKGNYAGWMDHRTFMEDVFARALRVAADTVRAEDSGSLPSISGTQAPGPSNAVNWYLLDQIVDYLQPYSEDDQDELHRTMRPGLVLTGFTGYERHGGALRHELWHRLFHGHVGASLFWQYTALNADLTMTEQGRDLARTVGEIRNEGLALLLRGAERENCGIAVHYSLLSVRGQWITDGHIPPHEVSNGDATSAHLKRFHANRSGWLQALEDMGYQYDFLTTEQIEAGRLSGYKVLILPDSIALSDPEVTAIRKFVEGGGLLISDAEPGLMDGHARWQAAGRIDDVLGVQRVETRSAASDLPTTKLHVGLSAGVAELEVHPATPSVRTTTGRPGAAVGEALFLIDHPYGAGHSLCLNFWMADYEALRKAQAQGPRLTLLRDYLEHSGVRPVADVARRAGGPLKCSEIIGYRKGESRYVAVLPEPNCPDAGEVTITLGAPRFVYDLRAHRFLGRVPRVTGRLSAGEPLLYSLLPFTIGRLTLMPADRAAGTRRARPGTTIKFSIRTTGGRRASGAERRGREFPDTPVHVEVLNPAGKVVDYYGGNILLKEGATEFSVPLALNDPPGVWHVIAREPFAHHAATATFEVTGQN